MIDFYGILSGDDEEFIKRANIEAEMMVEDFRIVLKIFLNTDKIRD